MLSGVTFTAPDFALESLLLSNYSICFIANVAALGINTPASVH